MNFLAATARWLFWGIAILAIAGLIALISVPAAFFAGAVALVAGWWSRSSKTMGLVFGGLCVVAGLILFFVRPQASHPPFTSCSVYPIPLVQKGSPPPVVYERTVIPSPKDPKPWVSGILAETYLQLSVIEGAEQRIQQARTAAIAHARDTGETLAVLDSLLEQADARLKEQQLSDVAAMRTTLEGRAKELAKTTGTEDAFRTAWQMDGDVRRVASVALVLTNLDNEIARLFTGLQSSHGLSVAVRGRDLVYRETLTLTATGGSFSKINPSAFLDAARQAEPTASLLWSTGPASRLETAAPGVLAIPAGSRSVVLAVEWTERNAVVDTCRRMSALAFQGATIRVPGSYAATVRGEVIPMSRTDPVPMAVTFTASALRQLTVPAYSLFVASRPMKASDPAGPDGDEQILTLAQPVTEAAAQTAPVWIEMLPSPFRVKAIQVAKDSLFPANAPLTLILLGIATLASVKLVPRVRGPAAVG